MLDPTELSIQKNDEPDGGMKSSIHFYSIGVVAANKKFEKDPKGKHNLPSHYIEVVPIEHFGFVDGELTDNKDELEAKSKNFNGESWEVKVDTTPSIMAKWFPISNTNRVTAPDVRRGEVVLLWQFGDTDEYWWTDCAFDDAMKRLTRRRETIIWVLNNNPKEDDPENADNSYWVEWSTHRKVLHIHTSKNDEEPFMYDIQLDTKNGIFQLRDDDDNYIFLNSAERHIHLHNKDNSYYELNKRNITGHCYDTMHFMCKDYILDAKETITENTKVTVENSSESITRNTKVDTLNANDSHTTNTKDFIVNAKTKIEMDTKDYKLRTNLFYTYSKISMSYETDLIQSSKAVIKHEIVVNGSVDVSGNHSASKYNGPH